MCEQQSHEKQVTDRKMDFVRGEEDQNVAENQSFLLLTWLKLWLNGKTEGYILPPSSNTAFKKGLFGILFWIT